MKQEGPLWANRTCWTDMIMEIIIISKLLAKVRKRLTMSIKAIKWFFFKFSDLSLNSCLFVLLVCTHFKKVRLDPNITVTLKIQDTSGSKLFLPGETAIVVYDITQRRSFEEAKELVDEFTQQASPGAFVALVGNKADLESRREVSFKVSNVAMFI